jgi:hypothetical protein
MDKPSHPQSQAFHLYAERPLGISTLGNADAFHKQSQSHTTALQSQAYKITYTNGDAHRESLREFIQTFDDLTHDEIAKIEKKYKWNGKSYSCTLYTNDEEFGAEEYITHYRALGKQYGHTLLTEFDMEIIRRFSF